MRSEVTMERGWSASIRARLLLLVGAAILPGIVVLVLSGLQGQRIAREKMDASMQQTARLASLQVSQLIETAGSSLAILARVPSVFSGDLPACRKLFQEVMKTHPQFANIGLAALDGRVLASGVPFGPHPVSIADRSYFAMALTDRRLAVGEYMMGRITRKPNLNLGYPVLGPSGEIRGVLYVALDLVWLGQFTRDLEIPESAVLMAYDRNGKIIIRHPDPEKWVGTSISSASSFLGLLHRGHGTVELSDAEAGHGEMRYYTVCPLIGMREAGICIAMGISRNVVLAPAHAIMRRGLAGLGASALVAFLLAWWIGERLILQHQVELDRQEALMHVATSIRRYHELVTHVIRISGAVQNEDVFARFVLLANAAFGADRTTLFRVTETGELTSGAALGCSSTIRLGPGEGIAGHVAQTGQPYRTEDAVRDPHFQNRVDQATGYTTRSVLAMPVRLDGRLVGVLEFLNHPAGFGEMEQRLGADLADLAGVLLGRLEATRHLENLNAELEALNRVRTEFLTNVSHELRTPLTSLSTALDLLQDTVAGTLAPREAELFQVVRRNYLRLERQVRDVIYLTRLDRKRAYMAVSSVNLVRLVQDGLEQFGTAYHDKHFNVVTDIARDLPEIQGDPDQLDQVLVNLLTNAGKFTPAGGTVGVQVRREGGGVHLCVWDTGPGIPEELGEKVFEQFFRIPGPVRVPGTGIGLAIVKAIVTHHGGRVWVEGGNGRGARFNVYLPASPPRSEILAA